MSAEDWGFDPYADIDSLPVHERAACRYCKHPVGMHNRIWGCGACTCMATPGEAQPKSESEWNATTLGTNQFAPGYRPEPTTTTAPRKDADMKTAAQLQRELDALAANEALILRRRSELEAALAERAALPSEPGEGSVIKFRVQFDKDGIVYEFIAFRTRRNSSAQWYTTGTKAVHKGPHSWDDLLNLMHEDQGIRSGATKVEFFLFDESGKWVR